MSDPLRNRIQQWEASPPPGAWQQISREIRESEAEYRVRERLSVIESPPPANSWSQIARGIGQEASPVHPPVIPIRPLYPFLLRYAAVAVVAGLLAWVLIDNPFSPPAEEIATSILPAPHKESAVVVPPPVPSTDKLPAGPAVQVSNIQEEGEQSQAPRREPRFTTIRQQLETLNRSTTPQPLTDYLLSVSESIRELQVQQRNLRYITVKSASGEQVKLSAKFANTYYHQLASLDNGSYPEMMDRLQKRVMKQPFVPDPNNLLDILHFSELLQKEQ